jgi:hypothetical protein
MSNDKKKVFISHIADEHPEAARAKEFLEKTFGQYIEVFLASSWESIAPGDDWFKRIEDAIAASHLMLVFASTESVARPWILFETGAAWFSKKKVIPVCHKGMTPAALPEPIRRLQAVDINAPSPAESLTKLAEAVRTVADLPNPEPVALEELPVDTGKTGTISLRGWMLRPASHIGEISEGVFKVGQVDTCDVDRAKEADVDPKDALFVRLYVEPGVGGLTFLNAIAAGRTASLFEQDDVVGKNILATIELKAVHQTELPGGKIVPIILIQSARLAGTN